jgi:Ala-tRNA(Pro) deacylase
MMYENIKNILEELALPYKEIEHIASTSCEHSKELREKQWLEWIGSKNIVFHAKGKYYLVTTLGDKDIKARNFKSQFGTKDIRFASQEEITKEIWWTIGCIPPFWFTNMKIPLFIDMEIFDYDYFLFNPWIATKSIQVSTQDLKEIYKSLKNPISLFRFEWEEKIFEEL